MPESMNKMLDQLSVPADKRDFSALTRESALTSGVPLPAPSGVFPRFVEE